MTTEQLPERKIREEVADTLEYMAGVFQAYIEEAYPDDRSVDIRHILFSWVRDLRTGSKQQRSRVERL